MAPDDIPPPPDGEAPPPPDLPPPHEEPNLPPPAATPTEPTIAPRLDSAPPESAPTDPVSTNAPANPLPFLILVTVALIGAGVWFAYNKLAESNYTAGPAGEKPLKAYKGDIAEDGGQFTGIWKGHDNDEEEPTNWEIIRRANDTFSVLFKKYYDNDLSTLSAKGTWSVVGNKIRYKIKEKKIDGPDLGWPVSWDELIGDIQANRVVIQAKKTPSRLGPYTENRVAGFGYAGMRGMDLPSEFKQLEPPPTEEPAEKVSNDLLVHYDFNGTSKNLADRKYEAQFLKARLTEKDVPESFDDAAFFEDKESAIEIKGSDTWNLSAEDFSISLWLRFKGSRAAGYGILDSISSTTSNSLTGIGLHTIGQGKAGAIEFLFYHRDAKYRFQGETPINNGKWHHIAVTKSGHLVQLYVSGQPEGKLRSIFRRTGYGNTTLALGKFLDTGLPSGAMDNFRLYKRTLSPAEILAIFEAESPTPPLP